jgi:DNA polymerase-3 subunit beta
VLANVLLTADAASGLLNLTGFDLALGIQASIAASVETSGAITLPARLLGEIVSRLAADSPITLAAADGEQAEITSLSGSYQVRGLPAADYPDLPLQQAGEPISLAAATLAQGLRATLFASSGNEAKQLLTGVHIQATADGLEFAATDGHRLAVQRLPLANPGQPFALTIPARSLRELERLLADATDLALFTDRGQAVVTCGDRVLTTRMLDGTYPNYPQLIPATFGVTVEVPRKGLLSGLERVAVVADQHNNVVKLTADPDRGQLLIRADAQDVGSGSEALAAEITGGGVEIAFNVRYLIDGLKTMAADEVTLHCNAPTTPAVLRSEADAGFTYLVMPVQVRA